MLLLLLLIFVDCCVKDKPEFVLKVIKLLSFEDERGEEKTAVFLEAERLLLL